MQIQTTADTTDLSYWLNWRFLFCAIWVLTPTVAAVIILWKYERSVNIIQESDSRGDCQKSSLLLYFDKAWRPCVKRINPICLAAFRVSALALVTLVIVSDFVVHGGDIFFYYTQWTFALTTIYFWLGSVLSIYGCYQYNKANISISKIQMDMEQGLLESLVSTDYTNGVKIVNNVDYKGILLVPEIIGRCSYLFQILFQMAAGAVMLTDSVYWFVIFPFLTVKNYDFNIFTVVTHSLNAVLLLGDAALNSLWFPWFRMSYFVILTGVYVIFQWIVHACVSLWWPYPFLDLSLKYSPVWYLLVALLHIPCYGIFALLVRLKQYVLLRWFPQS
ncbi:putative tRNA (adenine-N(1)-)-methyltransferase catalytic subunit TRMT61A [Capsicum annuum]|nr:putative tRNA (adenine-N(1)-)-methyltransferase catalytic subunit TRMT61A [Capsicum annuum]